VLRQKRAAEIEEVLSHYPERRAAMIPLLYMAQEEYGYLTPQAIKEVADILELDPTDVYGVARFYSLFYLEPVGKFVIRFCTDLPCALVGAEELYRYLLEKLGLENGGTTPDGLFTVQEAVCLASCGTAPVMQINFQYFEHLTREKIDEIIALVRAQGLPPNGKGLHFAPRPQHQ